MDAVEAMSSMESKAERIARYKAERRRELAERYANMEDLSSKHTRHDRQKDTASEAGNSGTDESSGGRDSPLSRGGLKGRRAEKESDPEAEAEDDAKTAPKTTAKATATRSEAGDGALGYTARRNRLEAEEARKPKADQKTDNVAKTSIAAKMSLFKELEKSSVHAVSTGDGTRKGSGSYRGNTKGHDSRPIRGQESEATSSPSQGSSNEDEENREEKLRKSTKRQTSQSEAEDDSKKGMKGHLSRPISCRDKEEEEKESTPALQPTSASSTVLQGSRRDPKPSERLCALGSSSEEDPRPRSSSTSTSSSTDREGDFRSSASSLQRQDSGQRSIKGILKKSRSTSVDTDPGGVTEERNGTHDASGKEEEEEEEEEEERKNGVKEEEEEEEEEGRREADEIDARDEKRRREDGEKKEDGEQEERKRGLQRSESSQADEDEEEDEDEEDESRGVQIEEEEEEEEEEEGEEEEEEEEREDRRRRMQRERSSSSDVAMSPSPPGSLEKTSSLSLSEEGDEQDSLEGSMSSSLKERLSELTGGEDDSKSRLKKSKAADLVQTPLADRFNQLHDAENAWRKKKSAVEVEPKMSLADRMKILQEKEEAWKCRGKGAANDSIQFSVAGRMAKKGLVSPISPKDDPPVLKKYTSGTPVKPLEEIASRPDVAVEGDKRLDKLESFLDRLHSKGVGKGRSSTIEVTEEKEKEVMTLDDDEMFGRFYKPVSPGSSVAIVTEQDFSVINTDSPKLASAVAKHKRAVRPSRNNPSSRNPLRALAARDDLRQTYTEQRLNIATVETKRIQMERMAKHSNLADVALAGLASKENFRKVNLRSVKSTEVVTNNSTLPFNKLMLIHIKGRRHVQVRLVESTARSLNSGDCFLLITPKHCFLWIGEFANVIEKAKGSEMAQYVQAKRDLGCKAPQVTVLEEGINTDSRSSKEFWNLLGGKCEYRGAGEPDEDEMYESGVLEATGVYRLAEGKLVPHEEAWASIPSVTMLNSKEVLVFDFGSEVYVWHGKDVPLGDRKVAVQLAKQLYGGPYDYSSCSYNPLDPSQANPDMPLQGEGRPSWCLLGRLSEHNETALFREKFLDWSERKSLETPVEEVKLKTPVHITLSSDSELRPCDVASLLQGVGNPVRTLLEGVDVQRGHGLVRSEDGRQAELATVGVDAWHIREFDDFEIPQESVGQLHEGDTYVIRWKYTITNVVGKRQKPGELSSGPGRERSACFFWQGRKSSVSGRGTSALMTVELGNHRGAQVLVAQGKEPPCFLQLFQGGLTIHSGCREDSGNNTGEWRLFCVRGEVPVEASLVEVECCCASLRSRASLVLLGTHASLLYLWHGCKSHPSAREVAKRAVERLTQTCSPEFGLDSNSSVKVQEVEEGAETKDFWKAIGQQDRKAYDCMLQDPGKYNFTPRLFRLSASAGTFQGEEQLSPARVTGAVMAMPFLQDNLYSVPQPALFLLDNRLEVYLWQGPKLDDEECTGSAKIRWDAERKCAMETTLRYCKEKNSKRPPQAYLILAGAEPRTFTNIFPYWERDPSIKVQDEGVRNKVILVQDALSRLSKRQYSIEELTSKPLPEGVDPLHLEIYLSDKDFKTLLELTREEFIALPNWKQLKLKKSKDLF
ncbi:supervillin [Alosa pseudoharengus]|uniref:supervillin n=1 Tax=Alosa pseudoharengus TaxID=34774 RepID=UPI003F8BC741